MDELPKYEICIEGILPDFWSDWFDDLEINIGPDCVTTLSGSLSDQAALIGILNKVQSLNLMIISVKRSKPKI
jgi:hypothetical protein